MKPLTVTKMKINLTWQLLVEVSKSPQDRPMWCWSDTNCNQWSWIPGLNLAHGLPVFPWLHHPPAGLVIWALWGERCLLRGPFRAVRAIQRHVGCAQAEAVSGSAWCSQPDQPLCMLRNELLWVGTWCPLSGLAICALFTARSPTTTEVAQPQG